MSGRRVSYFFIGERNDLQGISVRMSLPEAVYLTVGRLQVTTVLRKTISQKKIPTKPGSGLIFKDLLLQNYGRISGN